MTPQSLNLAFQIVPSFHLLHAGHALGTMPAQFALKGPSELSFISSFLRDMEPRVGLMFLEPSPGLVCGGDQLSALPTLCEPPLH